ncbi:MAG: adenine phosphoribosyltransferase [Peptostreptococcaceae bacterium]|nr:adenine phosphoribosyltransferase [Peptostreptococcaceae bacterium]
MELKDKIRVIEGFPKEGISYKDITTLLKDGEAYQKSINECIEKVKDIHFDLIVAPEARGFLIGAPIAYSMGKGFVPVRKAGKLPYETLDYEYELEYGTDVLQMHKDGIKKGQKVLVTDDLLATGGTIISVIKMVEKLGGEVVGILFLMELEFLKGRERLEGYRVESVVKY